MTRMEKKNALRINTGIAFDVTTAAAVVVVAVISRLINTFRRFASVLRFSFKRLSPFVASTLPCFSISKSHMRCTGLSANIASVSDMRLRLLIVGSLFCFHRAIRLYGVWKVTHKQIGIACCVRDSTGRSVTVPWLYFAIVVSLA